MAGPDAGPETLRRQDWLLVALATAPVLVLAVVAVVSIGHGYHGADDNAMNELHIADIGRHWPLIGPFSRDGWSHPGPALYYLLVLPFRLTGGHANGLLVGAALLNTGAISGMVVLARRWGGTALAVLVTAGCLLLVVTLGPSFVWDPWNPFVTVLPFGLVVLATWAVVCGDTWCLPVVAAVGSFCAQTHVGYVPLVAVLAVVAGVGVFVGRRRPHVRAHRLRAPLLATAVVLAFAWIPPLFQQVTTDPGNLWAIFHFFGEPNATHSWADGFDVVSAQFAWNPGWLVGRTDVNAFTAQPTSLGTTSWPVWWLPLGGALTWAWVRGTRRARSLGVVLLVAIGTSIVAVARTLGPIYEYRLRFLWVLGMLTAVYVLWVVVEALPAIRRAAIVVVLAAAVGLAGSGIAIATRATPPHEHEGRVIAALVPQLVRHLPPGPGAVVFTVRTLTAGPLLPGLMVDLERHGVRVAMRDNPDDRLRFGAHRVLGRERVRADLVIAADAEIEQVASSPCARMVAYWGRAGRAERARAVRAIARITRDLAHGRLVAPEAFRRVRRWSPDLPAAAIFRVGCRPRN